MRPYPIASVGWTETPSETKFAYVRRWARGRTALDLGCGRGWYAMALAEAGFQVVAMDLNPRFADARIDVRAAEITPPLPFEDQSMDTVLLFDLLEHLDDEDGILRELARITKQRLVISVPNNDDGFLPRYALTYLHRNDCTHRREYRMDAFPVLMQQYGFDTLALRLEGLAHIPLVFSEFVRGPRWIKAVVRYGLTALYKVGVLYNNHIAGDIFWVGEPTSYSLPAHSAAP